MPQAIFDVVAENPEIEHITEQVHPSFMDEHAREERRGIEARRDHAVDEREELELGTGQLELVEEYERVETD